MTGLAFWKMQSVGNAFVLVHGADVSEDELAELAVRTGAQHFGVGSDGLLAVWRDGANLRMRMFNTDGSEDFCGNGLRCAARHCHDLGWVGDRFEISHHGRSVAVEMRSGGLIRTVSGHCSYRPSDVPTSLGSEAFDLDPITLGPPKYRGSALTTGSTHLVLQAESAPGDEEVFSLGPMLEHDARFPERTSVIWAWEEGPMALGIRIWERGVGETLGCGTGSSAAAVDYTRRRGVSGSVSVRNPGGTLSVFAERWDGEICVDGTASEVFRGVLPVGVAVGSRD